MYSPIQLVLPQDYSEETLNTFLKDRGLTLKNKIGSGYKLQIRDSLISRNGIVGVIYRIGETEIGEVALTIFSRDPLLKSGAKITVELMTKEFNPPLKVS